MRTIEQIENSLTTYHCKGCGRRYKPSTIFTNYCSYCSRGGRIYKINPLASSEQVRLFGGQKHGEEN
jgi:hypothetical protein